MSVPIPPRSAPESFLTTRWSLVLSAGRGESKAALESLCASYWYPLYAFARRKGEPHERAADLVQGFFLVLLERRDLDALAPERGRFRSFLLAALSHHMSNERDRERALKRGGGATRVELGDIRMTDADTRYALEPADEESPEKLFQRRCRRPRSRPWW
jgi:RNA polymerase sigma-70 factor (ECF subfamily)